MVIPRKPDIKDISSVDAFINKVPLQSITRINDKKKGRSIISLSLMTKDLDWINQTLNRINADTERKITRSEIVSAAITVLKRISVSEIMELVKNR